MAEYIKREDAYEWLIADLPKHQERIERILNNVPSKDIIFCKDCKYWYGSTCRDGCDRGLCHIVVTMEDDYCSYGKRREKSDG